MEDERIQRLLNKSRTLRREGDRRLKDRILLLKLNAEDIEKVKLLYSLLNEGRQFHIGKREIPA